MTVTIVDAARPVTGSGNTHPDLHAAPCLVTGGVDTHLDLNVAAALDPVGGLLAVAEFPTTSAGHRDLLGWLSGFGPVARVGVEGTGSYGAGLARFLRRAGVEIVEVDRPNRQARWRSGKSDPLDAVEAARAALSGDRLDPPGRRLLFLRANGHRAEGRPGGTDRDHHAGRRTSTGCHRRRHRLEHRSLPAAAHRGDVRDLAAGQEASPDPDAHADPVGLIPGFGPGRN